MARLTEYHAAQDADFQARIAMVLLGEAWTQVTTVPDTPTQEQTRDLKFATAVIQGGANKGIGKVIAGVMASQGLSVATTDGALETAVNTNWGRLASLYDANVGAN